MAKTDTQIKTAPFESIRSGEVSVGVVSPPFEDIRANRDQVYGMRAKAQPPVSERIRPVLEGTRSIDDYLPPAYVEVANAQPDPEMYRERTTAAMLLADDMKMDFDMIDQGFDSAVLSRFGEPLSAPQVVDRLSPYKRIPQLTAGNKDNWFVTNFEKYIREPITEATGLFHPYIGEYAYDPETDLVYKRRGRGVFGRGILGEKPTFIPRAAAKRKGFKEAVGAGLSQAGIRGARSVAGTAEAAGELVRADKLAEWGRLMAEAADTYYAENPDEAMQLISGRGVVGTTYQFITRPEMIVQGVVETVPMLLEAFLGHITGTKAAQIIGKGARVLPWAGRVIGMGTEIFGNEYHDARKAGTPPGPALAQATLTSTIEGMIEEFTLSKKVQVFHGLAGQTAKKGMAKAATSLLLEYTKAYPRGFAEEGSQRMNSNFWRMVFTDKQSLADDFTQRLTEGAAEDAAVGGILEMVLTGGFIAAGKAYNLVTDEEKLNRVKNLRNFVRKDPNITAADKKEINAVFDNVKTDILGGKYQQGPATQAFREKVRASEAIKGDDQKTDVVMALTQARANALGKTTEQFIEDTFVTTAKAVDVEGEELFQEAEDIPKPDEILEPIPGEKPPWEMSRDEFSKSRFTMSEALRRLHENRARLEGLDSASEKVGKRYLKQLENLVNDKFSNAANIQAAEEATNAFFEGKFAEATILSETALQQMHFDERSMIGDDRLTSLYITQIENAISEGKTIPTKILKEFEKFKKQPRKFGLPEGTQEELENVRERLLEEATSVFGETSKEVKELQDRFKREPLPVSLFQEERFLVDDQAEEILQAGKDKGVVDEDNTDQIMAIASAIAELAGHDVITEADMREAVGPLNPDNIIPILTPKERSFGEKSRRQPVAISGPGSAVFKRLERVYGKAGIEVPAPLVKVDVKKSKGPIKRIKDFFGKQEKPAPTAKEKAAASRKKAAVQFTEDGKAIITAFKAADFSSMVHELAHVFRRTLDVELLSAAEKWAGVDGGVWTTKAEEKFARAFERYLWEGKAPTQKLRAIFAKMREWLRQIYQSVRGTSIDINLSPAVKETFDQMFTGPAEIHPGEMTKSEFIEMALSELEKREGSVWIEKYLLNTRETPTQAHSRLRAEWQGQQDSKSAKVKPSEKGVADLTTIQKQQIARLEAEVVSEDIIQSIKDQPIEELLSRGDSDFFVIADFRQKLVDAFTAGKSTTIEAVKRQYKEMFQRSNARKQMREYIQKLARQIAKPAPTTVDLFYREAIAILQLGIDPSFRAKKTLADRQATRKFLEKYPDRELPRKLIEIINKKALNEYTIKELEQLAKERKRLQELGKKKKALRLDAEARKLGEIQGQIVGNIRGQAKKVKEKKLRIGAVSEENIRIVEVTGDKGQKQYNVFYFDEKLNENPWTLDKDKTPDSLKEAAKRWLETGNDDAIAASTTRKPLFKTGYQAARAKTLQPSRIFDMFDGGKATFDGIMHRTFYDAANRATDAEFRVEDARSQSGDAKLKELGLTLRDLASKRIVAGVEYSVQEMMGIYGFGKNFKSRLAVQFGNKISKRAMAEITHHLESEDPRLAELTDWIIAEFEENFTRLEDAFIDDQERRLIKEESYLPMRRKELDYTPDKRDLLDDLKASLSIKRAQTKKGFTLERADIPAEFQKPIQLDLWSLWLQQVKWQEHYIHHAKLTRDLHRIAGSEEFRSAVTDVFGEAYTKVTTSWVSRVANPYVYKSFGYWNNFSRKRRGNAALSYLTWQLVVIGKQLPSLLYYLADAGPVYLAASAAEFVINPVKMINRVRDLDPQVRHPALERTLEELKIHNRQLYDSIIKKVGMAGIQGVYWMDAVARTIGWNAVYRRGMNTHKTTEPHLAEAEAIRLAQNATLRTQPAAAAKDLAEIYVSNEALNWFLMFSNQLNKIYNITTYDIPGYWSNKQYAKAGLATFGLTVAGAMIWAVTNRKLPDSPEEFIDMLLDTPINMIPLVGREIQAARRGFGGGGIGTVQDIGEIVTSIEKGKFGKALEGVGVYYGVPTVGPKRVFKAVVEEDITELIGGEPRK